MSEIKLHRCRFFDYSRPNISALAFNLPSPGLQTLPSPDLRLAVGRSNGDIEIWNPSSGWFLETTLGGARDRSIEDLAWTLPAHGPARLFSIGASDSITEWDLAAGRPVGHYRADAGVIWAISLSPDGTKLAVATETGTIVLFDVTGGRGSLEFYKRLQSADVSFSSVSWLNNNLIIAGGADARVRAWDIGANRIVATMKVDKSKGSDQTIVWAVQTLRNGQQFASGDSNGYIKIWDTKTMSLLQSFQAHPTDIMCLAADAAGEALFSSGLDQKIVLVKMTDVKNKRWTVMSSKVAQSHDIRSMTAYEAKGTSYLATGGLERTIAVNSVTQFDQRPSKKLPLTVYHPQSEISTSNREILEWREQTVRIWTLESGKKRLLAEVVTSGGDEYITSASLSPSAELLAVATTETVRLFSIMGLQSHKVESIGEITRETQGYLPVGEMGGAKIVKFSSKHELVVLNSDDEVYTVNFETRNIRELAPPERPKRIKSSLPHANSAVFLAVSPDGSTAAVAKHNKTIEIYDLVSNYGGFVGTLPSVGESISAVAFTKANTLAVATVSMIVYEFDTNNLALTAWSRQHSDRLPLQLAKQSSPCCGIFNDPVTTSRLWLWGPTWLAFLDRNTTRPYRKPTKRREVEGDGEGDGEDEGDRMDIDGEEDEDDEKDGDEPQSRTFWLTTKYRPIFFAGAFGNDILVSEKPAVQNDESRPFWSNRHIKF